MDRSVQGRWEIMRLVVDLHLPLSEVEKWDLDDIRQANAILDMRQDHEAALDAFNAAQIRLKEKGRGN